MFKKIRFELFIINQVSKVIFSRIKNKRSLDPVVDMLFCQNYKYKVNDEWQKGNYYTYIKNYYN